MKTRAQRKYLDQLPPELVRAVLSCVRPSDALPLARCSKHWRDACLSDWSLWRLWYLADFGPWRRGISPKHVWRGRYQRAWALRIEPGKRACGLTLGEDFSTYSPRATLRTVGEAPYYQFPCRGRLTIRYVEDEDLEYYLREPDDVPYVGEPDPDECHVGVELSEGDEGPVDSVVAYDKASLFDPARPFVNRAGIRPGSTLRQLLAAFRLTLDDVECHGSNWHGPLCSLDDVDGLLFVVERQNGEDAVMESWLDRAIVSFDVVPSSEEDDADAAIASFMAITGSSDENTARFWVDAAGGNVELAVGNFLNGNNAGGGAAPPPQDDSE